MISFPPLVIGFKTTMTLSRSFLNGALAIAGITAAFGFATKAQAFTVSDLINLGSTGVLVSDKLFYDFVIPTGTGLFDLTDAVDIVENLGSFDIDFRTAGGTNGALTAPGQIKYKVKIVSPFINVFQTASIQSNTTLGGGTKVATRKMTATPGNLSPSTLTATNNGSDSGSFLTAAQLINVTDSWSFTGSGAKNSLSSLGANFTQDPELPTVPEPSAVLGLLALGLCGGLVGRQKKG